MSYANVSPNPAARDQLAGLATVTLAATTYFATAVIVLHFVSPDFDPVRYTTSFYARGSFGLLMSSAFLAMSIATFALIVGLGKGVVAEARTRTGLVLLGVWGVGVLIAMLFPIGMDDSPPTLSNSVHRINGPVVFLALSLGALLISLRLNNDKAWLTLSGSTVVLSLVMLAGFVGFAVDMNLGAGYAGLVQRIVLVAVVTWYVLLALRLRALAANTASSRR